MRPQCIIDTRWETRQWLYKMITAVNLMEMRTVHEMKRLSTNDILNVPTSFKTYQCHHTCPNVIQNLSWNSMCPYDIKIVLNTSASFFPLFDFLPCRDLSLAGLLSTFSSLASRSIACSIRISFKTPAIEIFLPGSHNVSPVPRNALRSSIVGNLTKVATLLAYFLVWEAHIQFLTLLCAPDNICSWLARAFFSASGSSGSSGNPYAHL